MDSVEYFMYAMERMWENERAAMLRRLRSTPQGRTCLKVGHQMSEMLFDDTFLSYYKCHRCGEETIHEPYHPNCRCDIAGIVESAT